MNTLLRILHLEDLKSDVLLVEKELKKSDLDFKKVVVDNKASYIKALKTFKPDIVLSDHSLPSFNSVEALKILKKEKINIPFILITATMSEEYVVEMMKEGISDYIIKDRMKRLPRAILNAIEKNKVEKERQEFLQKIIENQMMMAEAQRMAKLGSFEIDLKNNVTKWSDELFVLIGLKPGNIKPSFDNFLKFVHPEDVETLKKNSAYTIRYQDNTQQEFRLKLKDGAIKYIYSQLQVERDASKKPVYVSGFNQDITDRVLLENKLEEERLRSQQELTEAIITAQEQERSFLGQELHDNINQILATSKIYMDLAIKTNNDVIGKIITGKDYLLSAIEEIRKLSKTLIPPSLGEITLTEALSEVVENIRQANQLQIIHEWKEFDENSIDEKTGLTIFRIVQEQLNNILKHAKAKKVLIKLRHLDKNVELTIKDNGIGFDTTKKRKGVGLKNIASRTELAKGIMLLNSAPGRGCELIIRFKNNS